MKALNKFITDINRLPNNLWSKIT